MKTADIKVGEHYARFGYKYGTPEHVEVLETAVPEKQGYGYSRRTTKSGVRVRVVGTDREYVVSSRQIERLWSEQEVINENAKAARKAMRDAARDTAARRANLAKRLDAVLADNGVPTSVVAIYRSEQFAALTAAGFETATTVYGDREGIITRLSDLTDLMQRGDVAEKDVEVLLANIGSEVSA